MDSSTFRRALVSTFSLDAIGRVLNAVTAIILLRFLEAPDFAFIVLFMAAGLFLGTAASGGVRLRYVREEAERISRGLDAAPSFLGALAGGSLLICAITALAFVGGAVAGVGIPTAELWLFLLLVTGFAVGQAATELASAHHQAHLAFVRAGMINVIRGVALLPVALAVGVGLLDSGAAAAGAMSGAMLALGLAVAAPLAVARHRSSRSADDRFGLSAESRWLTVFNLAFTAYWYMDVYVIAAILDPIDVATFGAAQRYWNVLLAAVPPVLAVLRVRTSQRDIVDSSEAQREMLISWGRRLALPVAVMLALAAAVAPFLIPLIDDGRYPQSIPVFQAMLVGAFAIYVTMPSENILMSQRRFRTLALTAVGGLGAKALADVLGGTLFGVVGVAVATTVATVLTAVAFSAFALQRIRDQNRRYETAST
jgi:O-antigen/teichoic acid export membrane protein